MYRYWKLIPIFLVIFGCAAIRPNTSKTMDDAEIDALFVKRCAGCHGADGEPPNPNSPDFTDPKFQSSITDEQMIKSIDEGKNNRMPAYGTILEKEEIVQLVAHIRKMSKKGKK